MRPWEVTAAISPRAEVLTTEANTSCRVRGPASARLSWLAVRAIWPDAVRIAQQGSSAISRASGAALPLAPGAAARAAATVGETASDSSSTVRRGVPYFSAISASSSDTRARSRSLEPRMASSSAISPAQLVLLLLQLDPGELGQLPQPQFQDVVGLDLGEVEDGHQPGPGRGGVVRGADDLDDLVDVHDGDEEALDQVQAVLLLAQAEGGAPRAPR